MKNYKYLIGLLFVVLLTVSIVNCGAIVNEDGDDDGDDDHEASRVHEHKLSDHEHYTEDGEHNDEYDQEAFLGKEEAEKFKKLSPEEKMKRLGEIVDKIDTDDDGSVEEEELHIWIKNIGKRYVMKDVDSRWKMYDTDGDGEFSLEDLLKVNYAALDHWTEEDKENKKEQYQQYMRMMDRDTKRFEAADENKDGKLNKTEYANFLHPEEANHMRHIVIDETLEDIDKNKDGSIDVEEYIRDLFPDLDKSETEPDWVKRERDNFAKHRDANGDGKMDRDEVSSWIIPADYDHTLAEAKHLIYEADEDKDGKLSKEEVIKNSKLFVSSQATGYGDALHEDL